MKRIIALALACVMVGAMLCACTIDLSDYDISFGISSYKYENANKYTAGNGSAKNVTEIDIDWINGDVKVEYSSDMSEIEFSESYEENIDSELKMHWWVDGSTLKIKFAESGAKLKGELNKLLTVKVPYELAGISITTVSADIATEIITAKEAEFDTVSGEISTPMCFYNEIDADSVSGDIHIQTNAEADIDIDTVSGYVTVSSGIKELSIRTVSGNAEVYSYNAEYDAEFDTTSGDIIVHVTENTGLELEFDTVSGDFESDVELSYKDGKYKRGDKGAKIEVDTVSGNCTVRLYDSSQQEGPIAAPGGPSFGEPDDSDAGRNG